VRPEILRRGTIVRGYRYVGSTPKQTLVAMHLRSNPQFMTQFSVFRLTSRLMDWTGRRHHGTERCATSGSRPLGPADANVAGARLEEHANRVIPHGTVGIQGAQVDGPTGHGDDAARSSRHGKCHEMIAPACF